MLSAVKVIGCWWRVCFGVIAEVLPFRRIRNGPAECVQRDQSGALQAFRRLELAPGSVRFFRQLIDHLKELR